MNFFAFYKPSSEDLEGRWPKINKITIFKYFRDFLFGCKAKDGHLFWVDGSRWKHCKWIWRAFVRKWIFSRLKCKLGIHRIGPRSDIGFNVCG